jgi:hypothetical protein
MDVILLPPAGAPAALFSPLGEQRLETLLSWFLDRGEFVRLYACLPGAGAERRWLLDFLAGAGRKLGVESVALLEPAELTWDLLEALHTRGLVDLVLREGTAGPDSTLAAVDLLGRYRAAHAAAARPGGGLACRLWLAPGAAGDDSRRLARLARSAPWLAVEEPGFELAAVRTAAISAGPAELPAAILSRPGGCWLYHQSLTVDAAGRLWMCPRHAGGPAEGRVGELFADPPEELLAAKQAGRARLGRTRGCRRCGLRGRFQWPEPPRLRPGLPAAAPDVARNGDRPRQEALTPEVDAADPLASGQALEAFEARLEDWSAHLEDWESRGEA